MTIHLYEAIEKQCSWWEMYARIVPVGGIMMFLLTWYISRNLSETIITTGIALLCITFAVWWYWAVVSIAKLARSNKVLLGKMQEIHSELCYARNELQSVKQGLQ